MATDKLYTVAGVSTLNGDTKARFANDVMRIKVLAKNGHENIQLVELPNEMTKVEAAKFLAQLPEFQDADSQLAISEYLGKHDKQPKVKVERKPAKAKGPATNKAKAEPVVAADAETVDFDDLEDAPF